MTNPDYHAQDIGPDGIPMPSREHELFSTLLANFRFDPELGFLCSGIELRTLEKLSVAMATHSPYGKGWERLGRAVFYVIQAQREGDLSDELVEEYFDARAAMTDDGLPEGGPVEVSTFSDEREESGDVDIVSEEGGYRWHTDGRPPEPLK